MSIRERTPWRQPPLNDRTLSREPYGTDYYQTIRLLQNDHKQKSNQQLEINKTIHKESNDPDTKDVI